MNKKGDFRLKIGIATAILLILTILFAVSNLPYLVSGVTFILFLIALAFWKFTR